MLSSSAVGLQDSVLRVPPTPAPASKSRHWSWSLDGGSAQGLAHPGLRLAIHLQEPQLSSHGSVQLSPRGGALRQFLGSEPQGSHSAPGGLWGGEDGQQTGTGWRRGPARLTLAEAPLSTSRMTRGWLGLLSMSCFVFSNTCTEGSPERGLRSEAQTPTPRQQPVQPLLGESSTRPRCRDPPASAHRLC